MLRSTHYHNIISFSDLYNCLKVPKIAKMPKNAKIEFIHPKQKYPFFLHQNYLTYVELVQKAHREFFFVGGSPPFRNKCVFLGKSGLLNKKFSNFFFACATLKFMPNDALSLGVMTMCWKNGREIASPKVSKNQRKTAKNLEMAAPKALLRARPNYYPILVHLGM